MNYKKLAFRILLPVIALPILLTTACKEDNNDGGSAGAFDRKLLLENFADNIIIPYWGKMKTATDALSSAADALITTPNTTTLQATQTAWTNAYTSWLYCNSFNYGPGEKPIFGMVNENIGTWPVNVGVVENRIAAGDFKFNDFRRDSRGLLTVEYLLFTPTALDSLTASSNRRQYLQKVIADIKTWVDENNTGWTTYRNAFVSNTDKSAGSPTSMLYNEFVKSFEAIKNFKIALPGGKRAGQPQPEPHLCEAYYSGQSIKFIKEHFKAVEQMWRGTGANGTDGIGFDDYLDKVTGGTALKAETLAQLAAVNNANKSFADNEILANLVLMETERIDTLHTEYQKMTRFFKSDLSSLLGIAITYSSGDGD